MRIGKIHAIGGILHKDDTYQDTAYNTQATPAIKWVAYIGDGSSTSFLLAHNLGTVDVVSEVKVNSPPYRVEDVAISYPDDDHILVEFGGEVPSFEEYRLVVIG